MRRNNAAASVRLIVAALIYLAESTTAGSCRSAKLCCQGRDSGCVIQKESPNAIIEIPRDKPCYCDHACLKLADCCDDFKETCGVVDCAVSEWSPWTPCNNRCGSGTQKRSRVIEISERNGGKHCPRLEQVRSCRAFEACRSTGIRFHEKSVATLLSLVSVDDNRTNPVGMENKIPESSSCVAFTIVRASRTCAKISNSLMEGSRICVEHRDGEKLGGIGRWKLSAAPRAIGSPANSSCHGKWIGDSRLLIDCDDARCSQPVSRIVVERSRNRRSIDDDASSRSRTVRRRRRRGRRRKRSRRRRDEVLARP